MLSDSWIRTYCGPAPGPEDFWVRWNFDPLLLTALLLLSMIVIRARSRQGMLAVGVLVLAFVSPLCALSSALFSARVVHHVLLVAVAAPLLACAWPARRAGGAMGAFVVSTAVLWGWHLPAAYDLALSHVGVYWLMQVEGIMLLVAGFAQMGMLGAILTFAPEALYAAHAIAPFDWGFTPLTDQQLGGILMWVPAGLPYAVVTGAVARRGWSTLRVGTK